MGPEIDRGGFWFPDAGGFDAGQIHKGAVFRPKGHVLIRFGHDRRFAGNWIAHHAKAILGPDHKGKEAIKIGQAAFQRLAQCGPVLHAPCQIGGPHFGVIFGLDVHALAA